MMAQTISDAMNSLLDVGASAMESMKWAIGKDKETHKEMQSAIKDRNNIPRSNINIQSADEADTSRRDR